MSSTSSILGFPLDNMGPGQFYLGTTNGSPINDSTYVGGCQNISVNFGVTKSDVTYAEYGTAPANKIVTGDACSVTLTIAQPILERIHKFVQGFNVQYTSGSPTGFSFGGGSLGQGDTQVRQEATLVLLQANGLTSNFDRLIFPLVAPETMVELPYDNESQRTYEVTFTAYKSDNHQVSGEAQYFYSPGMTLD